MSLIQSLPSGPLDIVGDIHGEYDALKSLLGHLGYATNGEHPQGRTLVFVGDFCDRGPNSPCVLSLVQSLVQLGRAVDELGKLAGPAAKVAAPWSAAAKGRLAAVAAAQALEARAAALLSGAAVQPSADAKGGA